MQSVDLTKAVVQPLHDEAWSNNGISVDVLRLDAIHPVLSGNKWFKLKYHLSQTIEQHKKGILTFGGAYSNHLVATAIACKLHKLSSICIVRGEAAPVLSPTLQEATDYGMELLFVSRTAFGDEETLIQEMQAAYPDYLIVPQGGQSLAGIRGAAEIPALAHAANYTHIACAVGTGTMLAGITQALLPGQQALGISSLKVNDPHNNTLHSFVETYANGRPFSLLYQYHFGGYARKNSTLLAFMNDLYRRYRLPTDFVYTAKLFYGINDLIHNNYFAPGARLLAIHSGGLQGNRSLSPGTLDF